MATSFGLMSTLVAMSQAKKHLSQEVTWSAKSGSAHSEELSWLLERWAEFEANPIDDESIAGIAAKTAAEINQFLADKGFDIQLEDWLDDGNTIGLAGTQELNVRWQQVGQIEDQRGNPYMVTSLSTDYPAFRLIVGRDDNSVRVWQVPGMPPIVQIATQHDNEYVYLVAYGNSFGPASDYEYVDSILTTLLSQIRPSYKYPGVIIPMVSFDIQPNVSWLKDLFFTTSSDQWKITQAVQQVLFQMNHLGARSQEATAMAAMRGMPPADLVFDQPFLLSIVRAGQICFVAHITREDWKNPGDLSL